jgi:tRNA(Ile)-lysidine synthase
MQAYPKPGETGGRMIREVIRFLRTQKFELPISSHILIAVSGGADSMALADLMIRYGRRVVDREKIRILHVNHGWRGEESDADERRVRAFAKSMGVPFSFKRAKPLNEARPDGSAPFNNSKGRSLEDLARDQRKSFFDAMSRKYRAPALTAHHGDDLAETVLWRIMTGAAKTHGAGITFQHGCELRPFLTIRKDEIYSYLKEENISWGEDRTNFEGRFLRSRIRLELMPVLRSVFPQAAEHLMKLGLDAQSEGQDPANPAEVLLRVAETVGHVRTRRVHRDLVKSWAKEIHLPGGWKLKCERNNTRWVLEKS